MWRVGWGRGEAGGTFGCHFWFSLRCCVCNVGEPCGKGGGGCHGFNGWSSFVMPCGGASKNCGDVEGGMLLTIMGDSSG